ncbi:hypothetical protein M413DRAFT_447127 [Hebeloma cylindrosporum]|uniref:Uncharacterized protein n=1 Tax=Hebeloma cylindrosporum TaxID=76867 RepID=A0A0C3C615_HEBCY|nr:hypothetical protein M413DRAFT_447127 [Hebeloma cylindrosporum h7]
MHPRPNQVCLSFSDPTKRVCITIPTFEDVKQFFATFHREIIVAHPYASAAVLLFWACYPKLPFQILYFALFDLPRSIIRGVSTCLGFEHNGVRQDSIASRYQSQSYTSGSGILSRALTYGAVNNDLPPPYNGTPRQQPRREDMHMWWTLLGWMCVYAALVIVLQYGGDF